jgi:hypothetical protein
MRLLCSRRENTNENEKGEGKSENEFLKKDARGHLQNGAAP